MMRAILGISGLYHDAAAALVVDGRIVAAAQEERFTRKKHDPAFPRNAIAYCLGQLPAGQGLDAVAFYEDPILSFDRVVKNAIQMAPASAATWDAAALSQLTRKIPVIDQLRDHLPASRKDNLFFVDHHLSHAASAFLPSPFEEAAIIVADGIGEWASTSIGRGRGTAVDLHKQIHYPHSLGLFYSAFTQYCGLKVNSGEYKLMGLAPYGEPRFRDIILDKMIDLREDGSYRLDMRYFGYAVSASAIGDAFEEVFGPRREPESDLTQRHMDIAASAQAVIDEAMIRLARHALAETGTRTLCLAGGVALNCVTNGKLLKALPELEGLWIQPASGDAGGALGCALHVAHGVAGHPRPGGCRDGQSGSLLGPEYSAEEMAAALDATGLVYMRIDDAARRNAALADLLADGKIIGRFDGRMEFGPRALGNRSIIADARRPDGQTHINMRIKFRESWRPFAPLVLAEAVSDYFDLDGESPYMLVVANVREDLRLPVDWAAFRAGDVDMMKVLNQPRSPLPSITHVDYSARIQTVDTERSPDLHALMSAFRDKTGCPVLINTSFNVRGEPIVCSPQDAINCFINTGMDVLAIGPFIAVKAEQSGDIRAREGSMDFDLD